MGFPLRDVGRCGPTCGSSHAPQPWGRCWGPPSARRRQGTSLAAATVVAPFFLPQRRGHRGSSAGPSWVSSPPPVAGACAGDERLLFGGARQPRRLRVWLTPCAIPRGDVPSWNIGGDAPPHGQLPELCPFPASVPTHPRWEHTAPATLLAVPRPGRCVLLPRPALANF